MASSRVRQFELRHGTRAGTLLVKCDARRVEPVPRLNKCPTGVGRLDADRQGSRKRASVFLPHVPPSLSIFRNNVARRIVRVKEILCSELGARREIAAIDTTGAVSVALASSQQSSWWVESIRIIQIALGGGHSLVVELCGWNTAPDPSEPFLRYVAADRNVSAAGSRSRRSRIAEFLDRDGIRTAENGRIPSEIPSLNRSCSEFWRDDGRRLTRQKPNHFNDL